MGLKRLLFRDLRGEAVTVGPDFVGGERRVRASVALGSSKSLSSLEVAFTNLYSMYKQVFLIFCQGAGAGGSQVILTPWSRSRSKNKYQEPEQLGKKSGAGAAWEKSGAGAA